MTKKSLSQLALARRKKLLVRFTRPFESGSVNGYVLEIGPRFFLVALVADGIRFNGFQCFRLVDVRRLRIPSPYAGFVEAVLKKRGERMPKPANVSVASIESLLKSASRGFPLVTIHREKMDPDVCQIGRVTRLVENHVSLLQIAPDASWDEKPETYRMSEITRVDFGGDYEEALHLIGGDPMASGLS